MVIFAAITSKDLSHLMIFDQSTCTSLQKDISWCTEQLLSVIAAIMDQNFIWFACRSQTITTNHPRWQIISTSTIICLVLISLSEWRLTWLDQLLQPRSDKHTLLALWIHAKILIESVDLTDLADLRWLLVYDHLLIDKGWFRVVRMDTWMVLA